MLKFDSTKNFMKQSNYSYLLELANLIRSMSGDVEIAAMQDSIPEWKQFEDGMLKDVNEITSNPLVKDPKIKIESLFDDEGTGFKFQGFKPVPWRVFLKKDKNDLIGEEDNEVKGEEEEEEEEKKSESSSSSSSNEE